MVSIMAAMARNRVIGKEGRIPWSIPGEQTWFRQVTWGKPVILGRVSWEEIGGPPAGPGASGAHPGMAGIPAGGYGELRRWRKHGFSAGTQRRLL